MTGDTLFATLRVSRVASEPQEERTSEAKASEATNARRMRAPREGTNGTKVTRRGSSALVPGQFVTRRRGRRQGAPVSPKDSLRSRCIFLVRRLFARIS